MIHKHAFFSRVSKCIKLPQFFTKSQKTSSRIISLYLGITQSEEFDEITCNFQDSEIHHVRFITKNFDQE